MTSLDDTPPAPADATAVAYSTEFQRVVSVALMRVVLAGPPDVGDAGRNMCRYIVNNPAEQAARFAVALAAFPDVVDAARSSEGAGMTVLVEHLRAMWSVMAGETGDPGGVPTAAAPALARPHDDPFGERSRADSTADPAGGKT